MSEQTTFITVAKYFCMVFSGLVAMANISYFTYLNRNYNNNACYMFLKIEAILTSICQIGKMNWLCTNCAYLHTDLFFLRIFYGVPRKHFRNIELCLVHPRCGYYNVWLANNSGVDTICYFEYKVGWADFIFSVKSCFKNEKVTNEMK